MFLMVIFENSPSILNIKQNPFIISSAKQYKDLTIFQLQDFNSDRLHPKLLYIYYLSSVLLVSIWSEPNILDMIIYTT